MKPRAAGESGVVSISGASVSGIPYSGRRYSYEQSCRYCLEDLSAIPKPDRELRRCPGCGNSVPPYRFQKPEMLPDWMVDRLGPPEDPPRCKQVNEDLLKRLLVEEHNVKPDEFASDQIIDLIWKLTRVYGEIEIIPSDREPLAVYSPVPHPNKPTDSKFWRELQSEFGRLSGGDDLMAYWYFSIDDGQEEWRFWRQCPEVGKPFSEYAKQAAAKLGYPPGDAGLDSWLTLLRRNENGRRSNNRPLNEGPFGAITPKMKGRAEVHLYRLCTASASYCVELETVAMENDASQHKGRNDVSGTTRGHAAKEYPSEQARILSELRNECGWSYGDLARETGMDKTLIQRHAKGKGIQSKNLDCYADAFTKKLKRQITVAVIKGIDFKVTPK